MDFYKILLVAGALGTDAFSLAIGMGLGQMFNLGFYLFPLIVGIFHIIMPLGGLWLGDLFGKFAGTIAASIGGLLLILIGFYMLNEARTAKADDSPGKIIGKGNGSGGTASLMMGGVGPLILAAASVSLDALTVGFGLGTLHANLAVTVITMGVVAGLMTGAGLILGRKVGAWLGEKAQFVGGIVLIAIGISMFFQ